MEGWELVVLYQINWQGEERGGPGDKYMLVYLATC